MLKFTELIAACALFTCSAASFAQPVYRVVGPDGKVTFSDKAPAEANVKATSGKPAIGGGSASNNAPLPFELRQVVNKFPVTLYTGDNCNPCQAARSMLTTRGVPFTEKTVITNDDIQALQRLGGDNTLPFGTIGGQQLKGYSDSEWTQFLNAAGYPAASVLPSGYRQSPVTPMVAIAAAPAAAPTARVAAPVRSTPSATPDLAPAITPANPTGIRF